MLRVHHPTSRDIEKKEKEIESLLKNILQHPIGEFNKNKEDLDEKFNSLKEGVEEFKNELRAFPDNIREIVKRNGKNIGKNIEDLMEKFQENSDSTLDKIKEDFQRLQEEKESILHEKISKLSYYANIFYEIVDKTPENLEKELQKFSVSLQKLLQEFNKQRQKEHDEFLNALEELTNLKKSSNNDLHVFFGELKKDEETILDLVKKSDHKNKNEFAFLKKEIDDIRISARSHKTVLFIFLIITLCVACGDGIMELVALFHHHW